MKTQYAAAGAIVVLVTATAIALHVRVQPFRFHYENVMGTSMDVTVVARRQTDAGRAAAVVLDRIDHDSHILSGYDSASEFSRWLRSSGEPVSVSPELYEVL